MNLIRDNASAMRLHDPIEHTPTPDKKDTAINSELRTHQLNGRYGREIVVKSLGRLMRLPRSIGKRWKRLWWSVTLHADARRVGRGVHCYGPIWFLGTRNVVLGGEGNLYDNVLFETVESGSIRVGDGFRINRGTLISAHVSITIGNGCLIGEAVSIRDNNHVFDDSSRAIGEQGFRSEPITIADDVWIGRGATVLQGVTLGQGAVVGANSVVTKSIPPMQVWAGAPARFVRHRGEADPSC